MEITIYLWTMIQLDTMYNIRVGLLFLTEASLEIECVAHRLCRTLLTEWNMTNFKNASLNMKSWIIIIKKHRQSFFNFTYFAVWKVDYTFRILTINSFLKSFREFELLTITKCLVRFQFCCAFVYFPSVHLFWYFK